MIHQPLGGAQGQAADIEIQANEIMVSFSVSFYLCRNVTEQNVSSHGTASQVHPEWISCRVHRQTPWNGAPLSTLQVIYFLSYKSWAPLQVMEDTDRDFFMSATEAKEYGLIDTVIEHPTDVAVRSSGIPLYAGEL